MSELKKIIETSKKMSDILLGEPTSELSKYNNKNSMKISEKIHTGDVLYLDHETPVTILSCKVIDEYSLSVSIKINNFEIKPYVKRSIGSNHYTMFLSMVMCYAGDLFEKPEDYIKYNIEIMENYFKVYNELTDEEKELMNQRNGAKESIQYNRDIFNYFKEELKNFSK